MKLHLGVLDVPYTGDRTKRGAPLTTGDVATILEDEYGIMAYFAERHLPEIAAALETSAGNALEDMLRGAPPSPEPLGTATGVIEDLFKRSLDAREYDSLPGVPTQAAKDGVSHRKKRPYVKRDERPSFIDTGLYQSSFKSWLEE